MKRTRIRRVLLAAGIMVLAMTAGATAIFAQEPEEKPLPDSGAETDTPYAGFGHRFGGAGELGPKGHFGGGRFGGGLEGTSSRDQRLADALNIPLEELQEARTDAYAEWLAEMAAEGTIEQEQVDLMLAYSALRGSIDRDATAAAALGISVTELTSAREAGKTMAQILEDAGLSTEEFMAALVEAHEAAVQAEVGVSITQEQADLILESGSGFGPGTHGIGPGGPGSGRTHGFGRGHGLGSGSANGQGRGFGSGVNCNFGTGA